MRRIDRAVEVFKCKSANEIIAQYCPRSVNRHWPDIDDDSIEYDASGCRGISCEECWCAEFEETLDIWINATDKEIAEMTLDDAIVILKNQIEKCELAEPQPHAHVTHALEMLLEAVEKK